MVKVSICIPAYNNRASLARLLDSIEQQSFRDYEVIITDDSDGDEIRRLAEERGYIRYYKNSNRSGPAANWNAAIEKSCGEYVKIMHHDDWFTTGASLQAFVDLLEEHPEADMAFSGSCQVEGESCYERCISGEDAQLIRRDWRNLFLGNTIGAPSAVIVRRRAVEAGEGAGRYDENLTWLVDMEYYMGILKKNPCFAYTEEPLISIGVSSGQLTESCREDGELNAFEYGYIYQKYGLGEEKRYRRKLVRVCADGGKSFEAAAGYGIGRAEYGLEQGRKLLGRIQWKLTHLISGRLVFWGLLFLFLLSLVPVLMLSGTDCATGDDFGYGILTRRAWVDTRSLWEVFKAAGRTVQEFYQGWQGTWFSIFLFALQPEVFSAKGYVIVPVLMLVLWLLPTALLAYELLVRRAGYSVRSFGILFLLFSAAAIQFVPSTKSSIFWYNGTAHYVVPYALALLAILCYLRFMAGGPRRSEGAGWYAGLALCMTLLGGVNYQAALLVPIVIVLVSIAYCFRAEKRKRAAACLLPLLLEAVGLIISMKSPGNRNRGGEDFGFSLGLAAETVLSCFVRGAVQAVEYIGEHPLLLLFFGAAAVAIGRALPVGKESKSYPLPGLFVLLSYCVYCAMFAPELYAGVEVSGGVRNMNFYIFLFMVFGDMIYVEGAVLGRQRNRQEGELLPLLAAVGMALLLVCRGDLKKTTVYGCMEYIAGGQAADFKEQMELQKQVLLDPGIREAVLPAINDDQGPLMHMPLTGDPQAWTNRVTGQFYGKDSVIAVPRENWEKQEEGQ